MLIAKVQGDNILEVADYRAMFPNTSFSDQGVHPTFYEENSLLPVCAFKTYDPNTERLVPCAPYIEVDVVYTVTIEPLPEPIIPDVPSPDTLVGGNSGDNI